MKLTGPFTLYVGEVHFSEGMCMCVCVCVCVSVSVCV